MVIPNKYGVVLLVDHIKLVSKYPQLSMSYANTQTACKDCNLGKSNKFKDIWL